MARPDLNRVAGHTASPPDASAAASVGIERNSEAKSPLLYLGLGLIALITFGLYLGNSARDFVADDFIFLNQLRFKYPTFWDNLIFFGQEWGGGVKFYRPISRLFWAAEYSFFKENRVSWHLTGVLLYSLNAGLVYWLAWKMTGRVGLALLAGLFFSFNPTHTEPVSWVAAQTDLLVTLFGLSGTILYLRSRQATTLRNYVASYLTALVCFALAMLSKESAAAFFFVPLLYDIVSGDYSRAGLARWCRPSYWLRLAMRHIPFWATLGFFILLRLVILGGLGGYDGTTSPKPVALSQFIEVYGRWLLSPLSLERTLYRLAFAGLVVILVGGLGWWEWQKFRRRELEPLSQGASFRLCRALGFGLGWVVLFLLPTLTTSPSLRFTYLSTVGVTLVGAVLLAPLGHLSLDAIKSRNFFAGRTLIEKIQQSSLSDGLRILATALLLWLAYSQVQSHQQRWIEAGRLSRSILTQLHDLRPDLVNYTRIVAAGLPVSNEEALIFITGFPQAAQLVYNNPTISAEAYPSFPIIEQNLLQGYLVEYQYDGGSGKLVVRDDLIEIFKARNDNIKDKKEQLYLNFPLNKDWAWLDGKGTLSVEGAVIRINSPEGGIFRPPVFRLSAPLLSNFEFKAKATPQNPNITAAQMVVHWLIETPGGVTERTSAPLVIQTDGRSRTYRLKPVTMSPFFNNENIAEIRLELPPGLTSLEIEQAALYRLP